MASGVPFSNAFFGPIASIPSFPGLNLSDDELAQANWLSMRLFEQRPYFELRWLYYDAQQRFQDLGISISPTLSRIRPALGWTRLGIDALVNRTMIEGFTVGDGTDVDRDLMAIWRANQLAAESQMTHVEAMVSGRAYNIVGPGDDSTDGQPLITSESPMNMAVQYDARLRRVTAAVQIYYDGNYASDMYGAEVAALYLPNTTVHLARSSSTGNPAAGKWEVTDRDDHGLGYAPVVHLANRSRLTDRDGASEITRAWMNTVDSACRTLHAMEISRELHAMPRRYVLGASETDFQNPDGTPVSKLKSYMDMIWLLERDDEGEIPTVGEFRASDPSSYTKVLDAYRQEMATEMGVPGSLMGLMASANPASADAIVQSYSELTYRAKAKQQVLSDPWSETMRLALLIRDGAAPTGAIDTQFVRPEPATPAATTDAVVKQITVGAVPATSDVVLQRLGYSPVERARLAQDRDEDQGQSFLNQIAHSLEAKDARVDKSLSGNLSAPSAGVNPASGKQPVPTPAQVFGGKNSNG